MENPIGWRSDASEAVYHLHHLHNQGVFLPSVMVVSWQFAGYWFAASSIQGLVDFTEDSSKQRRYSGTFRRTDVATAN